ncbi:MAG: serine/threonine-protein kinase [Pseudomonadota bacterium]
MGDGNRSDDQPPGHAPTVTDERHGGDVEPLPVAHPRTVTDERHGSDVEPLPVAHAVTETDERHGSDVETRRTPRGPAFTDDRRGGTPPGVSRTIPDDSYGADTVGRDRAGGAGRSDPPGQGGDRGGANGPRTLPERLRADWEFEERLSRRGGEAELWVVRSRHPDTRDERRVVKIYHSPVQVDPQIMRTVARLDPAHVVRLYEQFRSDDQEVELLEYVRGGSLDQLIEAEGPVLPPERLQEVVRELAEALAAVHRAEIVHRDLKPANILVRSRAPLDLVLTDFGIAVHLEGATRVDASGSKTQSYASPESTWYETARASDWWSLGIMIVEMVTGRHPFAAEGTAGLVSLGQMVKRLTNDDVEDLVAGVEEPWRLLCRGLLRRNMDNRWGIEQVRAWLDGDTTLEVLAEEAPGMPPFRFAGTGREHYALREVARALSDHWPEATASFAHNELQEWLNRACDQATILSGVAEIDQAHGRRDISLNDAVFRTILTIDPLIIPNYRGYALDPPGLGRLAEGALEEQPLPAEIIRELLEQGALSTYAEMRGNPWYDEVERAWHHQLDSYVALAPLVPEGARALLSQRLPVAVAAGLRSSLPDADSWGPPSRETAQANRLQGRFAPQWFRDLEALIASMTFTSLVGLHIVRGVAEAEFREAEARHREERAKRFSQTLTAGRVAGIIAIVLLAVLGAASLLGLFAR